MKPFYLLSVIVALFVLTGCGHSASHTEADPSAASPSPSTQSSMTIQTNEQTLNREAPSSHLHIERHGPKSIARVSNYDQITEFTAANEGTFVFNSADNMLIIDLRILDASSNQAIQKIFVKYDTRTHSLLEKKIISLKTSQDFSSKTTNDISDGRMIDICRDIQHILTV